MHYSFCFILSNRRMFRSNLLLERCNGNLLSNLHNRHWQNEISGILPADRWHLPLFSSRSLWGAGRENSERVAAKPLAPVRGVEQLLSQRGSERVCWWCCRRRWRGICVSRSVLYTPHNAQSSCQPLL